MTSAPEALADVGIHLKRETRGEHRTACPECDRGKKDTALAVLIDDRGATWLCHRCGWKGAIGPERPPMARAKRQGSPPPAGPTADLEAARKAELALDIWRSAEPISDPDRHRPGLAYLASRGLTAWDRDRLLFHPACPFGRETAPAIVAPVNCHRTGYVVGVWRIRLTAAGEKVGRFGLGPTKGNAARLFWAEGDELAIAEGVEDALAAHALTGLPAWAALSAGNMASLTLPERFRRVLILADADEPGRSGAHALATQLRREGRHAVVRKPTAGKDPNEVLCAGRAA